MMILRIGNDLGARAGRREREFGGRLGFTLIELIIVMSMLLVVMAVAAPSLKNFFKGRNLDSEARRFLALTRFGQSKAVSDGVPMILWMNSQSNTYGLDPAFSYRTSLRSLREEQEESVAFQLPDGLTMQVEMTQEERLNRLPEMPEFRPGSQQRAILGQAEIRFSPEGYPDEWSPRIIRLVEGDERPIWIGLGRDQRRYEIQTQPTLYLER